MTWTTVNPQHPPNLNASVRHGEKTSTFKGIRTIGGKPCCILSDDPDAKPYAVPVSDCEWWVGMMAQLHTAASWADFINGKYLSPDHPEWWGLERELVAARSQVQLEVIKERWPQALRDEVRERWARDGRLKELIKRAGL